MLFLSFFFSLCWYVIYCRSPTSVVWCDEWLVFWMCVCIKVWMDKYERSFVSGSMQPVQTSVFCVYVLITCLNFFCLILFQWLEKVENETHYCFKRWSPVLIIGNGLWKWGVVEVAHFLPILFHLILLYLLKTFYFVRHTFHMWVAGSQVSQSNSVSSLGCLVRLGETLMPLL